MSADVQLQMARTRCVYDVRCSIYAGELDLHRAGNRVPDESDDEALFGAVRLDFHHSSCLHRLPDFFHIQELDGMTSHFPRCFYITIFGRIFRL